MTDTGTKAIWRIGTIVAFGLVLSGIFGTTAYFVQRSSKAVPSQIRSLGPTISQLERMGELTSMRIHVADVLIADGDGHRGSWLIKGDAILACDVSRAKIVRIDSVNRTAIVCLPPPHVRSARLDHEKTKTWSVETTTWLPWSSGNQSTFRDAAMYHAQQLIEGAALSDRNVESARKQTETLIRQLYELVDWHVTVEWD